jgi:hypothetical protein
LLVDYRGQARRSARQAVLHLHLRQIGIGAAFEGQRQAAAAVGLRHRFHVDQAGRAVHLALDDGQHASSSVWAAAPG